MKKNIKTLVKGTATALILLTLSLYSRNASIAGVDSPPFPSCSEKIFQSQGDWTHYDYGWHGIPGIGVLEGSDDVYSLSSGNFLQCFCAVEGDQGYQTDWWYISTLGLTQEEIDSFIQDGWLLEQEGSAWNIFEGPYLAKTIPYSCSQPTPTPTITPTPTVTPTPTPTSTPTPTPTPHDNGDESRCVGLSASPKEGTAPLTVKFTGSGFDSRGDILEYEFDFGDASGFQPQVWKTEDSEAAHRYENEGTYFASLRVKDRAEQWKDGNDDCKVEIKVNGQPKVLGDKIPSQLPETGAGIILGVVALAGWGVYLYRRFKLV